jgi:hypothetical protein
MLAAHTRQTKAGRALNIDDDNEMTTFQHYMSTKNKKKKNSMV